MLTRSKHTIFILAIPEFETVAAAIVSFSSSRVAPSERNRSSHPKLSFDARAVSCSLGSKIRSLGTLNAFDASSAR